MMLQKILKSLFTVTAIVLLAGCSTAVFPEVIEDDSISVSESGRKVIKEGEGLGSDEKNAAYEEMPDEDDVFADVVNIAFNRCNQDFTFAFLCFAALVNVSLDCVK